MLWGRGEQRPQQNHFHYRTLPFICVPPSPQRPKALQGELWYFFSLWQLNIRQWASETKELFMYPSKDVFGWTETANNFSTPDPESPPDLWLVAQPIRPGVCAPFYSPGMLGTVQILSIELVLWLSAYHTTACSVASCHLSSKSKLQ